MKYKRFLDLNLDRKACVGLQKKGSLKELLMSLCFESHLTHETLDEKFQEVFC